MLALLRIPCSEPRQIPFINPLEFFLPTFDGDVVSLNVYDRFGKSVGNFFKGAKLYGSFQIPFDADSLADGLYFAALKCQWRTKGHFSCEAEPNDSKVQWSKLGLIYLCGSAKHELESEAGQSSQIRRSLLFKWPSFNAF